MIQAGNITFHLGAFSRGEKMHRTLDKSPYSAAEEVQKVRQNPGLVCFLEPSESGSSEGRWEEMALQQEEDLSQALREACTV